jgi:hypothetical protein
MVLETLAFSLINHLTRLVAQEDFIIQCHRESYKSYSNNNNNNYIIELCKSCPSLLDAH